MDFPLTGVTINPLLLAGIGFVVGILGGFFGVGGGFLAGPFMFWIGVPMNYVVGTDLAHMTGKSIVAAKRHRVLGHVDLKLGSVMVVGTVIGIEIGARIVERLQASGNIDTVIGLAYVIILMFIGLFTGWESVRAIRLARKRRDSGEDLLAIGGMQKWSRKLQIPPMMSFPVSGIERISFWVVLGVSFLTGLLAGTLGVGGGFVRMPMLIYFLGVPTHVAIGTDLFEIVISAGFGTLTHALKGNVDIMMALVMQTGAAVGAQIGASATQRFSGPWIRLSFAILPLIGAVLVILRLLGLSSGPAF